MRVTRDKEEKAYTGETCIRSSRLYSGNLLLKDDSPDPITNEMNCETASYPFSLTESLRRRWNPWRPSFRRSTPSNTDPSNTTNIALQHIILSYGRDRNRPLEHRSLNQYSAMAYGCWSDIVLLGRSGKSFSFETEVAGFLHSGCTVNILKPSGLGF